MKKLLGLSALMTVLVLSACGSSDKTVCTSRIFGERVALVAQSNDGVITSITTELRRNISDLREDQIAYLEAEGGTVEGNYIIIVNETGTPSEMGMSADLDTFIASIELVGGTCD